MNLCSVWSKINKINAHGTPRKCYCGLGHNSTSSESLGRLSHLGAVSILYIGWSMLFGIKSTCNAVRKCEIALSFASHYFILPDCIARAINPKYHILLHILI